MIQAPINATLPADGQAAALIALGSTQNCRNYSVQARGAVDMKISNLAAMTTYWTVKAGTAISLQEFLSPSSAFFYAVSAGAQDTIEVLPLARQ